MTIIRTVDLPLTDAIARHVAARLRAALPPVAADVTAADGHLRDINAVRGGADRRCGLVASLGGRRTIVAQAMHPDLYAAVDQAARRLRMAALRPVRRPMARRRKDPQRPGALLLA
jgi:ribosome-associated translation inhibitor RaiA